MVLRCCSGWVLEMQPRVEVLVRAMKRQMRQPGRKIMHGLQCQQRRDSSRLPKRYRLAKREERWGLQGSGLAGVGGQQVGGEVRRFGQGIMGCDVYLSALEVLTRLFFFLFLDFNLMFCLMTFFCQTMRVWSQISEYVGSQYVSLSFKIEEDALSNRISIQIICEGLILLEICIKNNVNQQIIFRQLIFPHVFQISFFDQLLDLNFIPGDIPLHIEIIGIVHTHNREHSRPDLGKRLGVIGHKPHLSIKILNLILLSLILISILGIQQQKLRPCLLQILLGLAFNLLNLLKLHKHMIRRIPQRQQLPIHILPFPRIPLLLLFIAGDPGLPLFGLPIVITLDFEVPVGRRFCVFEIDGGEFLQWVGVRDVATGLSHGEHEEEVDDVALQDYDGVVVEAEDGDGQAAEEVDCGEQGPSVGMGRELFGGDEGAGGCGGGGGGRLGRVVLGLFWLGGLGLGGWRVVGLRLRGLDYGFGLLDDTRFLFGFFLWDLDLLFLLLHFLHFFPLLFFEEGLVVYFRESRLVVRIILVED